MITTPIPYDVVARLRELKNDAELVDFDCEEALVLTLYTDELQQLRYSAFDLCSEEQFPSQPLHQLPLVDIFNHQQSLRIALTTAMRKLPEFTIFSDVVKELVVIPVTLLTAPLCCLLIPVGSTVLDSKHFHDKFWRFNDFMQHEMIRDLSTTFNAIQLLKYLDPNDLTFAFIKRIIKWIQPTQVVIEDLKWENECENALFLANDKWNGNYQLNFDLQSHEVYHCKFKLPSFKYFSENGSRNVTESSNFLWRKKNLVHNIQQTFQHVYHTWKNIHNDSAFLNKHLANLGEHTLDLLKKATEITRETQQIRLQLERLKQPTIVPAKRNSTHINWFWRKNKVWKIGFQAQPIECKINSEQGMEMIRYLLSRPQVPVDANELYNHLLKKGLIREKKGNKTALQADENIEAALKQQDQQRLQELRESLAEVDNLNIEPETLSLEEQRKYWAYLYQLLRGFDSFAETRRLYSGRIRKAREKILELNVKLGIDRNFQDEFSDKTAPVTTYALDKKKRDSMTKGIKRAIKNFATNNHPALAQFLEETIVYKHTAGFRPFRYEPSLATDKTLQKLNDWKTE